MTDGGATLPGDLPPGEVADLGASATGGLGSLAASWLRSPAGSVALAAAVRQALEVTGAPTSPGGPPGRLGDRLALREPLCEDTDWDCPLGPFRDTSIRRGTIAELCAARLTDLSFGLGAVVRALAPPAGAALAAEVHAMDEADACAQVVDALSAALLGPLRGLSIAGVAAATPPG